jgi:hypothetical protein
MNSLGAFQNPGLYSGNNVMMYGDVSNILRFTTTPVRWDSGRGGENTDVVLREKLRGVDEQVNRAIVAFWEAEAMTERQLRWNRQTLTDSPVPGYQDQAQRTHAEYARDFHRKKKKETDWAYVVLIGVGVYFVFFR